MRDAFFQCTTNALNNITLLFDLIWPLSAGLWNLRAAVQGIQSIYPGITSKQLTEKFGVGSGLHGVNYQRAFCDTSWERQKEELSWMLLNSVIPIYEEWLQALKSSCFTDMHDKELQFPNNIHAEISRLTMVQSAVLKNSFYHTYKAKKHRAYSKIEALLHCYRVFKEMRNCYMHHGRICDEKLERAYTAYLPYANPTALGVKEVPIIHIPHKDELIQNDLRGVVGFSHIVLKIIVSLDAELLCAKAAEVEFIERCRIAHRKVRTLKSNNVAAKTQVEKYVREGGFATPKDAISMQAFLLETKLVSR